jgi:hypothetical protein
MRFNLRIAKFGITFFVMLAHTQTLEGITSLQKNGKHIVMFDLENCTLEQAEETLRKVQVKYNLSDIFIVSDAENSFRGWCFSEVDFKILLKIVLDVEYLDWNFFYYTVKRKKATLRTNNKRNRAPQKTVSVLHSYFAPIPDTCEEVTYDTGIQKRGLSILLGDDGKILRGDKIG